MTPGLLRTFSAMYDHTLIFARNHQSRHQATSKMGHRPSDYRWLLPQGVFVWVCMG